MNKINEKNEHLLAQIKKLNSKITNMEKQQVERYDAEIKR